MIPSANALMRKYYLAVVLAILSTSFLAAQDVVVQGNTQIFLSSGSVFFVNGEVHINNTSSIDNYGQFEASIFEINNTAAFTNRNGATLTLTGGVPGLNMNSGTLANETGGTIDVTGQVDLGGGTLINNTGASFTAGGSTNIFNSTVNNTGTLRTNSLNVNDPAGVFNNDNGILQVENTLSVTDPANIDTDLGKLEFVGPDANKLLDIGGVIPVLNVADFTINSDAPSDNIVLESVVRVSDTLAINSGIVEYSNTATDSLVVLGGGMVVSDSVNGNGIMADALYRYPAASGEFMRFPVGDNTGRYRPFWIKGANYSAAAPKIAVDYLGTRTVQDTNQVGLATTFNQNSWGFSILENTFDSSIIQVQFAGAEATLTESVVAEGFEVVAGDTIFFNLGQGPNSTTITGGGVVESLFPAQGNSVVVIGQSTELKVRIQAVLEGAWPGAGTIMDDDYYVTNVLQPIFEFGGTSSKPMLQNKSIPVGAIDSIQILLRSSATGPFVDTASAWLMSDGTIRDYVTGQLPYAVFSSAPAGSYHVVLQHRNHLRVQASAPVVLSNVDPGPGGTIDFRNAANIRGGGGVKSIGGGFFAIVGGNSNGDNEVNASDYFEVGIDQAVLLPGYNNTDVRFDAGRSALVTVDDFTVVQNNSNVLYFSTVP